MLILWSMNSFGQGFIFRKVNPGTKAEIHSLKQSKQGEFFFLANKIFTFESNQWKKRDFPVDGRVSVFYPISTSDIWFSIDLVTSTSMLYHFHDGITENIRSPFSNNITAIHMISPQEGIFASISEVAIYKNGVFTELPPLPSRNAILKLYGDGIQSFWILTLQKELFLFQQGKYKRIFDNKPIIDFCFSNIKSGYFIAGEDLYQVGESGIRKIAQNPAIKLINSISLTKDEALIMVGENGLILTYKNGNFVKQSVKTNTSLKYVVAATTENVWISGEKGLLLYSGKQKFGEFAEDNQGFSSNKLIFYGITIDDEYGVAMADFNNDDKTDIYCVRIYEQNRLYINNLELKKEPFGVNSFAEEALKRNANGVLISESSKAQNELKLGISVADIDNDQDQDIYLSYLNSNNKLLLNKGDGYFRNVSEQKNRACQNYKRSNGAIFADIDIDGDLDLFITNEEGSNRLFENNGTGSFTDITKTSGLASFGGGMCASFADINNDGLPDLCATFWYPNNKLYLNESKKGKIFFHDITPHTDIAKTPPAKSNGVAFADVNNDGFIDLYIANRNIENKLYLNDGKGIFTDRTHDYFESENYLSNGCVFADFDLDGFLDLYVTNVGESVLYKNINGSYFKNVTALYDAEISGYCTGSAAGDIDNDGDPDLYVANYINGDSKLFINNTESKTFIKLKLHGVYSNKDAIGTKVWLYKKANMGSKPYLAGYRELNGGSGYGSISAKEMIFGIEKGVEYYALIKFPSTPDTLKLEKLMGGNVIEVFEIDGFKKFRVETSNSISRFFSNKEYQPEILKSMVVILVLIVYNWRLRKTPQSILIVRIVTSGIIFITYLLVNQLYLFLWPNFTFFVAPMLAIGLLLLFHLYIGRIILRRLVQKEKLDLREKLSRDLHDDLASTLGSISIYAETLKGMGEPSKADFKKLSVKIAGLTQSALQSISDIIWMTSPRNDSLQSLISKTSNYILEILTDNHISFNSAIEIPDNPIILQEKIRNDAFLILKEALHNVIKHSQAKEVSFLAEVKDSLCTLRLTDNGIGIMDLNHVILNSHGNGLPNMQRRAQESGMKIHLFSKPSEGTTITLVFNI